MYDQQKVEWNQKTLVWMFHSWLFVDKNEIYNNKKSGESMEVCFLFTFCCCCCCCFFVCVLLLFFFHGILFYFNFNFSSMNRYFCLPLKYFPWSSIEPWAEIRAIAFSLPSSAITTDPFWWDPNSSSNLSFAKYGASLFWEMKHIDIYLSKPRITNPF